MDRIRLPVRKGKTLDRLDRKQDKNQFQSVATYGEVRELTLDEIFGYEKVQKIDLEHSPIISTNISHISDWVT